MRAREQQIQQMQHIVVHDPKNQGEERSNGDPFWKSSLRNNHYFHRSLNATANIDK